MHGEDELTGLNKEVALLDDSYYRVYDDSDYAEWHFRMMNLIVKGDEVFWAFILVEVAKQTH